LPKAYRHNTAPTTTITCPSDQFDTRQQADTAQIKQLFAREVK
jgi:hypothetical protein